MADLRLGSMVTEDSGSSGPAVVLVHGLGGDSNTFAPLMSALDGCRALRPDLPGAGRSALRPGRPGLKGLAAAVCDAVRAAGIERAHFAGHSMGTLICQHLAADLPDAVLSLALFGPILEPAPAARQALKERAETVRREGMAGIADSVSTASIAEASRRNNPVAPAFVRESLMRQDPAGYAAHCRALATARAADHSVIRCPTLLIAGEKDPVAPVAMAEALKNRISGAELEILPDTGHWMTIEAPARSAELLRAHLDRAAG
ncbi:MAG: alpha/beta hydrolase [Rhodospirillaceae bacterium]|nr:alpha/beta hydrolase [Rhodospirillaceae bacterium]